MKLPGQRDDMSVPGSISAICRSTSTLLCALLAYGCAFNPIVIPPHDNSKDDWNRNVSEQVRAVGQDGDWLVVRGYKVTDHLVTAATQSPLSHVAVYDAAHDEIIEAESKGVHTETLAAFVEKSQHVILIRPKWRTDTTGPAAVAYARAKIGHGYDFLGTVGAPVEGRYYCSELAIASYGAQIKSSDDIPRIVKPSAMQHWGTVLYDSAGFEVAGHAVGRWKQN